MVQPAGFEQDHQIGPPGERLPNPRFVREQGKDICERSWCSELVTWNVGSHSIALTTDSNIFMYPVQRHRLPASAVRMSASVGFGFRSSRSIAARTIPGEIGRASCRER